MEIGKKEIREEKREEGIEREKDRVSKREREPRRIKLC